MRRTRLVIVIACAWAASLALVVAQDAREAAVWDGVYTAQQAERGKARFATSCSRCHNLALTGSERGPALKGNAFLGKWQGENLGSLFTLLRDTMPQDGAGVVSDEIKIDVLAYLLESNGFPAGSTELALDARALEGIAITRKTVAHGVFTAAQVERGREAFLANRCAGCHQPDLAGDRGPALKGADFLAKWGNGSVGALFTKIRDTMPPNSAEAVAPAIKADIIAFLLQSNGFPAGSAELAADTALLENIDIVQPGARPGVPNFALVQVVGCLAQGPDNAWFLRQASDPVTTRDEEPTAAQVAAAQRRPLGSQNVQLLSVTSFRPAAQQGQKMDARGLLYRDGGQTLLNLTSLRSVNQACAN